MKKVLGIMAAIIGVIVVLWLLSHIIEFMWELFWIAVVISAITYVVQKFR